MRGSPLLLLPLLFLSHAEGKTPTTPSPEALPDWDSLSADEVQKTFQLLRRSAEGSDTLSQEALNRAALRGILEQGNTGTVLLSKEEAAKDSAPSPPFFAKLSATAAYARPGLVSSEHLASLQDFLKAQPAEVQTLVLDLRQPRSPQPLLTAAALLELFLPEKTSLFTLPADDGRKVAAVTENPPSWTRRLWLLLDGETPNNLELAALILSRQPDVLTIGSLTAGQSREFEEKPLGSRHLLRVPGAAPLLTDGTSTAGLKVVPKLIVTAHSERKQHLFSLTDPASFPFALQETDRPHFNEAALMAGTNPELTVSPDKSPPTPRIPLPDPVLQQALDLLETSTFLRLDQPAVPKAAENNAAQAGTASPENKPPAGGK